VSLTLVAGERPESADLGKRSSTPKPSRKGEKPQEWLGANVLRLTPELAEHFRQPREAEGVLVTDVEGGSDAEQLGLLAGDVIRAINQTATPTIEAFQRATEKLNVDDGVVLDVLRQGKALYLSSNK
jgi:serine protease Do